jgi:hypothetical protein
MKKVFILWHTHKLSDQEDDSKLIGVYDSRDSAEQAQLRIGAQPGFAEHRDEFLINEYEIGKDNWTEGFVTV